MKCFPVVVLVHSFLSFQLLKLTAAAAAAENENVKRSFPAIFVFGDSSVDPGNNNYIGTPFKSNFPPYGIDFVNHIPTGRFTNGRLATDFLASYLGIKEYVPAYLDPRLSMQELITGVSFASAGSGFDILTALTLVRTQAIPMVKQVDYFKEYRMKIEVGMGKEKAEALINNSIFIISAGSNDYLFNYFASPVRRTAYPDLSTYQQFLMQIIHQFLQDLIELGARKILIGGIFPLECLPFEITINSVFNSSAFHRRNCISNLSAVAPQHNQLLQKMLADIQKSDNVHLLYFDSFSKPLRDIILNPTTFGFEDTNNTACCGTGLLETSFLCNPKSPICSNVSSYVFFDSLHPTESTYHIIFKDICSTIDLLING